MDQGGHMGPPLHNCRGCRLPWTQKRQPEHSGEFMTTISSMDNAFFQDPRRLDKLKGREGLEAAASEFEAMFLQMVLKNMRDATKAVADENSFLSSQQQDFYQSLADGQLATIMAKRGSMGIADALVKQDRKSTRLNSSHVKASYAVLCL